MSDEWDEIACPHMADWIESVSFPCACGKITISLSSLDMDDALEWLKKGPEKVPIYHMGMVGCCEKLRCWTCEDMPSECNCGNYVEWDVGERDSNL